MELLNIGDGINAIMLILTSMGLFLTIKARNKREYARLEDKIDCKAEKEYVDQQDRALHKRINEVREDNTREHRELKDTINTRFDDIKSLIQALHKND